MRSLTKAVAVTAALGLALTGCGRTEEATPEASGSGSTAAAGGFPADSAIGIALPQKTSENWVLAENLFNEGLTAAGFKGDVQFANGGVSEQQNQIQAMITKGAKVIVVGAIDGAQLGTQLKAAKDSGATSSPTTVSSRTRPTSTTTSPTTTSRSVSCRVRPCSTVSP
jgi:putative multiple sugar transport system substrate-binding protein